MDALISTSSGDLRRAITYLQSASRLSCSTSPPTPITAIDIQEIAGVVPDTVINDFANVLGIEDHAEMNVDSQMPLRTGFQQIRSKVAELVRQGYAASQIMIQASTCESPDTAIN